MQLDRLALMTFHNSIVVIVDLKELEVRWTLMVNSLSLKLFSKPCVSIANGGSHRSGLVQISIKNFADNHYLCENN